MNTKTRNGGFTHVELLTAITLMSTLSAVALPKWVDLSSEARRATMQSLAGSLTQASVMNGALGQLRGAAEPVRQCVDVSRLMANVSAGDAGFVRWQERELALADVPGASGPERLQECLMSDPKDPAAGEVKFLIQLCSDTVCRRA